MKRHTAYSIICCIVLFLTPPAWPGPDGPGRTPPGSNRPQINTQAPVGAYTIAKTTQYIEDIMAESGAVGVSIALVNRDGVVWEEGFGWADKENKIKAAPESVYMIGSVSKFLTALGLVRLHEQGLVDLDSPAVDYLPQFQLTDRFGNDLEQITVRRILNHHAAIPGNLYTGSMLRDTTWESWGCSLYSDWLFDYLSGDYPSLPPGTKGVYSNIGFALAGEIAVAVDGIAGESFGGYMERVLFGPLGMNHTSLYTITENLAYGYFGGNHPAPMELNCSVGASGGVYSTVQDMARMIAMILNRGTVPGEQTFLAPETVSLLEESEKSALDIDSYLQFGLGLDSVSDPVMSYAGRAWTKNGSTGNYNSFMEILPDMDLGVIVLANSDTSAYLVYGVARECLKNAVFESYGMTPSFPELTGYASITDSSIIPGIYAKGSGWDEIQAGQNGTLIRIRNAHSDTPKTETLVYNGSIYVSQASGAGISFTQLTHGVLDYLVMIRSGDAPSEIHEMLFGKKYVSITGNKIIPPAIPDAWYQRKGGYVMDNIPWNEFPEWTFPFCTLTEKDGILLWSANDEVLLPENETLAYVAGITNQNDSTVRVISHEGVEKLLINGYRMLPMDRIPVITAGQAVNGSVAVFDSDWYRFDAQTPGQTVTVTISGGQEYYLVLFDAYGSRLARESESISWVVPEPGTYYFYISPTPDAAQAYTMTLTTQ